MLAIITPVSLLLILLLALAAFLLLKNSKWWDRHWRDVAEEKEFSPQPETGEVIERIGEAEKALADRAGQNAAEAEKLLKDKEHIEGYLDKRGLNQTEAKE